MTRKIISGMIVALILVSALSSSLNTRTTKAHTPIDDSITIEYDGTVYPDTAPIQRSGDIYTLTDDIYLIDYAATIFIRKNNMIFDGNGHSITGDGSRQIAIFVSWGYCYNPTRNITIRNFRFEWLDTGIFISSDTSNNVITSNSFSHIDHSSVMIASSSNNLISNNQFEDAGGVSESGWPKGCITIFTSEFYYAKNNIISENRITDSRCGIVIDGSGCSDNLIYHNNLIGNTFNARIYRSAQAVWDNGYPSGGNYWSDYAGVDLKSGPNQDQPGSDGIGDTPYIIDSGNRDRYPLMSPWVQAENPMSVNDLWITSIEPVQTYVSPQIMIRGKPTVFKIVVGSSFFNTKQVYMQITCDGKHWNEGPYKIRGNGETIVYSAQFPFDVYYPSGEFDVKVKIDIFNQVTETDETNNEFSKHIAGFRETPQLKVVYVPVGFWGGSVLEWRDPPIADYDLQRERLFSDSFIKATFPIDPSEYVSELGSPQSMKPPPISADRLSVFLQELAKMHVQLKIYRLMGYDRVVAVVPTYNNLGLTWLRFWSLIWDGYGITLGARDFVCWCEEGYWVTPAHELWHSLTTERGHCSYAGEPGYWENHGMVTCEPCFMVGGDVYHNTYLGNPDLLNVYRWICTDCYSKLANRSPFICDPEIILVGGVVFSNDTVELQPFYHFPTGYADLVPGGSGNYTIRFLDETDHVLSDIGFNMTFEQDINITSFSYVVPFPTGAKQIQILHGETVIASKIISANSPTVNMIYPNSGEILASGHNITIQWGSNDPDNDILSYTVVYSPDNGTNWIPIQTGLTETSFNWTVPNDHPTDQCRIKVIATDGVNTGEGLSDTTFTILRHDVAVLDINASKNRIRGGDVLPFNVTVENCGNYTETFTLEAYANTTLLQAQNVTLTSGNITTVPLTWNTSGFAEGSYVVKAYVPQVLGEVNIFDNQYYGSVEIDSTAPVISILSPQNKTYYSDYIPLTFETNEPASWVAYSLNNQPNVTISGNTIIDIVDGTHQITVYANDTVGNIGTSQTIHLTINSSHYDPWKSSFLGSGNYPIVDFAVYNGRFYAAADNKLYVYDEYSLNIINAPTYITSLIAYEDKLIIGARDGLYYSLDGKTMFSLIFSVPTYVKVLGTYHNTLYASTMLDNPPKLYYCRGTPEDPANWYIDTDFSSTLDFSGPFGSIDSFAEYNNNLYVTSGRTVYCYDGTGWSIIKTYDNAYAFLDMQVYNGKLCLATRDQGWRKPMHQGGSGFSGRVIEYDGENWTTVLDHDYWVYSLEVYDDKLYAGTANKILTYNGTDWETSFNATEGAFYAISMITHDGKIYTGMGNGYIFVDPAPPKTNLEVTAMPEFPSATIVAVFMALTIPAVVLIKRKRPKRLN